MTISEEVATGSYVATKIEVNFEELFNFVRDFMASACVLAVMLAFSTSATVVLSAIESR
jgi:hypothetical protein